MQEGNGWASGRARLAINLREASRYQLVEVGDMGGSRLEVGLAL